MIRLVLAAFCALALAFSPAATSGAIAAPYGMPGCTMNGHVPAKPAQHSKMDCCTPACQVSAAAALLPGRTADAAPMKADGALHDRARAQELASFATGGLDPPPRTIFS